MEWNRMEYTGLLSDWTGDYELMKPFWGLYMCLYVQVFMYTRYVQYFYIKCISYCEKHSL